MPLPMTTSLAATTAGSTSTGQSSGSPTGVAPGRTRGPALLQITREPGQWLVRQVIDDPEADHDWAITAVIDLEASDATGEAAVAITDFGPVGGQLRPFRVSTADWSCPQPSKPVPEHREDRGVVIGPSHVSVGYRPPLGTPGGIVHR